ncbi:MAG: hypothetical protein ACOYZ8_02305 [Chloroflexota bacterium]
MSAQPFHTRIDKTIQTAAGLVVLESPAGFPRYDSNLYCLAANERIVWKAEKSEPNTLYQRVRISDDGLNLSAYTLSGHACEIDLKTGKLISFVGMK